MKHSILPLAFLYFLYGRLGESKSRSLGLVDVIVLSCFLSPMSKNLSESGEKLSNLRLQKLKE